MVSSAVREELRPYHGRSGCSVQLLAYNGSIDTQRNTGQTATVNCGRQDVLTAIDGTTKAKPIRVRLL